MTKTRTFTSIRVVFLALLATVASVGLLSAEDYKGTFTLPFETRWGKAVLPAGDYSFTIHTTKSPQLATIRGENGSVFAMPSGYSNREVNGRSELILVRRGNKGTVRALALAAPGHGSPNGGIVFSYALPKAESPLLARAPELIQRVPVVVSGK
jgi:hypothetical protein